MPRPAQPSLAFASLFGSALVTVSDYDCRICRGGPAPEEEHDKAHAVVLMRRGVFARHFGRRSVTAEVNQAAFFTKGATYRVSHPADRGDRGTVLTPSSAVLHDIVRELDPSVDTHPDRPFAFAVGPCDLDVFARHRALVRALERSHDVDPLAIETAALTLVADVVASSLARGAPPKTRRRDDTDRDHAERVEAVKAHLASHIGERVSLDDVARAVHVSPFHLARIFQTHTGLPIHRYLTQLRLRTSLDRIEGGADNLSALALELGFSSHSHFTDAFRSAFGTTPGEVRRSGLREVSKNLEV